MLRYKLHLVRLGMGHLAFSSDRRFPRKILSPENLSVEEEKDIIFIRHGESDWNEVFNKGLSGMFGRFSKAIRREVRLATTLDSCFFDSSLNVEGAEQAKELCKFLEAEMNENSEHIAGPNGTGKSLIVSSNLRRSLSTALIGFWERLRRTKEKIKILSSLQEVTFNVDGIALSRAYEVPELSETEVFALGYENKEEFRATEYFDASMNRGNKPIRSSGLDRLVSFAAFCFEEDQEEYNTIIASGHSFFFRYFFKYFLDADKNHEAKTQKIANTGVVKFKLQKGIKNGQTWYRIPEESLQTIHIGFDQKHKKTK